MSAMAPGSSSLPSSFGPGLTTSKDDFSAQNFIGSQRTKMLEWRASFYDGTCHDWKQYDFDGNLAPMAVRWANQPMLATAKVPHFVPLRMRRPSNPYRLGRLVANAHTALLFGTTFPEVKVSTDPRTQDFVQAMGKASRIQAKMIRARTIGGKCGTVGLSWCVEDGRPRVQVHEPQHLLVRKWEDREELVPRWVTKVYRYCVPEWDPREKRVVDKWWWYRRDYTAEADVAYLPVEHEQGKDPEWVVDQENTAEHGDGFCHFVWIQNWPSDEPDGLADYDSCEDNLESLDCLNSLMSRSLGLNLDPTMVLQVDPLVHQYGAVKKGSDHALVVGENGGAEYMELAGTSITVGLEKLKADTEHVLAVCQCVLTDPSDLAAQGLSSVAIKAVYAPMIAHKKVQESQYGEAGLKRLFEQQVRSLRKRIGRPVPEAGDQAPEPVGDEDEVNGEGDDGVPGQRKPEVEKQPAVGGVEIR